MVFFAIKKKKTYKNLQFATFYAKIKNKKKSNTFFKEQEKPKKWNNNNNNKQKRFNDRNNKKKEKKNIFAERYYYYFTDTRSRRSNWNEHVATSCALSSSSGMVSIPPSSFFENLIVFMHTPRNNIIIRSVMGKNDLRSWSFFCCR